MSNRWCFDREQAGRQHCHPFGDGFQTYPIQVLGKWICPALPPAQAYTYPQLHPEVARIGSGGRSFLDLLNQSLNLHCSIAPPQFIPFFPTILDKDRSTLSNQTCAPSIDLQLHCNSPRPKVHRSQVIVLQSWTQHTETKFQLTESHSDQDTVWKWMFWGILLKLLCRTKSNSPQEICAPFCGLLLC